MNALQLVTLAAIWGASFLFMRMGAPSFGAVPLIALRVAIAAVLLPVLRSADARREFRAHAAPLFVVGVANSALPFCLLTYAALFVSAGTDSILNATTPLWTALVAYVWLRAPLTKPQAIGLAVGFAAIVRSCCDDDARRTTAKTGGAVSGTARFTPCSYVRLPANRADRSRICAARRRRTSCSLPAPDRARSLRR